MELSKSPVVFDPVAHTYTLPDGTCLHEGITGMLGRQLFADKYAGVPEHVMSRAAERGTMVHEACELIDTLGVVHESPEAHAYLRLKETYGLQHEASEYLVSDEVRFATCIDKVYRDGDAAFSLADIKTTYSLDKEYVRWQLSVCAVLFEHQNPGAKVNRLMAVWLRGGKGELAEVERIPDDVVKALLAAEATGQPFVNPLATAETSDTLPDKYRQMEQSIIEIDRQARYWAEQRKVLMDGVMQEMVKAGGYRWKGEGITFTRRKDSIRQVFDREAFDRNHPGLYAQYLKDQPQTGSVTLKLT